MARRDGEWREGKHLKTRRRELAKEEKEEKGGGASGKGDG
jgi:hypothetical protein